MAKLPRFLDIEINPFVPSEFEVQIEEGLTAVQEQEAIREQIESTIRWRRVREHGHEVSCIYTLLIFLIKVFIDNGIQCTYRRMGRRQKVINVG